MSTFTSFNGPLSNSGASTKDITALIEAYNNLSVKLSSHIAELASTEGSTVHGVKSYVDGIASTLQTSLANKADKSVVGTGSLPKIDGNAVSDIINAITALNLYIESKYTKSSELDNYVPITDIDSTTSSSNQLQNKAQLDKAIDDLHIDTYDKITDVDTKIDTALKSLSTGDFDELAAQVVTASEKLVGALKVLKTVDFTKWILFNAPFAGTGSLPTTVTNGVYVLGSISTNWVNDVNAPAEANAQKCGTAYIKYVNTHPLDAKVDFVVTKTDSGYIGSLIAQVTKEKDAWENLAFHLVLGTDYNGKKQVYLAISANGLSVTSSEYSNTTFRACGINFNPVTSDEYVMPTGMLTCLSSSFIGASESGTVSYSSISTNELTDKNGNTIFNASSKTEEGTTTQQLVIGSDSYDEIIFVKRPYCLLEEEGEVKQVPMLAVTDITHLAMPVGSIVRWAPVDDSGKLKNVPDGWLDISNEQEVSATTYPELAELLGTDSSGNIKLPIETHSIIKAKYFDVMNVKTAPSYADLIDIASVSNALKKEITRATESETTINDRITSYHPSEV